MISLLKVGKDLDILFPGFKLLDPQPVEVQYKDFKETNLTFISWKKGYGQLLELKVEIESSKIVEIYPSCFDGPVKPTRESIPYCSVKVNYKKDVPSLGKQTHYYWVKDSVIYRRDLKSKAIRHYKITTVLQIAKICEGKIADFIIEHDPDKIYLYYDDELTTTFLLSYFPWNKSYKKLYERFITQDS